MVMIITTMTMMIIKNDDDVDYGYKLVLGQPHRAPHDEEDCKNSRGGDDDDNDHDDKTNEDPKQGRRRRR